MELLPRSLLPSHLCPPLKLAATPDGDNSGFAARKACSRKGHIAWRDTQALTSSNRGRVTSSFVGAALTELVCAGRAWKGAPDVSPFPFLGPLHGNNPTPRKWRDIGQASKSFSLGVVWVFFLDARNQTHDSCMLGVHFTT